MKQKVTTVIGALGLLLLLASCASDATSDTSAADAVSDDAVSDDAVNDAETEDADHDEDEDHADEDHADDEATVASTGDGVNLDLFFDGALAAETTTAACTLSDGTETECYQITIAGAPSNADIGPFCPTTTSDTADDVGIWLDGDAQYDLDGEFILGLSEIYDDDNWMLYDEDGNVNVTDTLEAFEAAARPDVDPAYQNHCVEGRIEWLEGGEPVTSTVEIPVVPIPAGSATNLNGSVGITLNGVTIDGQAPVDAILGAYTIAAFDDCGGHVNPFAGYHMHGATGCSEAADPGDGDTPAFGYAMDGYAIHSPLDDDAAAAADLDECNGHTSEASGYHYHANQAKENAVLTCLTGLSVQTSGRR